MTLAVTFPKVLHDCRNLCLQLRAACSCQRPQQCLQLRDASPCMTVPLPGTAWPDRSAQGSVVHKPHYYHDQYHKFCTAKLRFATSPMRFLVYTHPRMRNVINTRDTHIIVCVCVHMYVYTYIHTNIYICVCARECVLVGVSVCLCACVYVTQTSVCVSHEQVHKPSSGTCARFSRGRRSPIASDSAAAAAISTAVRRIHLIPGAASRVKPISVAKTNGSAVDSSSCAIFRQNLTRCCTGCSWTLKATPAFRPWPHIR